ncbi:universal stress protein [Pseudaestuariivita atlantica]|uniref:UspA domain-containing protein n=1 Tax=Pseudaestuariivita atlantica TaxID=1317121 RepID=A0A0L1JL14_9RHOB|nr:universal stress protein [Pseudaestuariivita atlantica]KNG92430.1 hypothetical protein ATO11_17635 [Pseudaestuariivita atlantica]
MKILAATDLSERSDRALARAFQLAGASGARLSVVHVLDEDLPDAVADPMQASTVETQTRLCDALADGQECDFACLRGDPVETLLREADTADLLVMGAHRPRKFLDMLRETTMSRIVRHTRTPVLLVTGEADGAYSRILAATDFSPASVAAMRTARRWVPGARITPVHALEIPYTGHLSRNSDTMATLEAAFRKDVAAEADAWEEALDPDPARDGVEVVTGSPLRVINEAVQRDGADLVAVGAHGRVGGGPALLGSLATDLIRTPPCDVLVARP